MEHLFETYLTQRKLSPNTIKSYNYSRELFFSLYPRLTQRNLEQYKLHLLETYRPQTVNLRIRGINCYLEFCGKDHWKLPCYQETAETVPRKCDQRSRLPLPLKLPETRRVSLLVFRCPLSRFHRCQDP